MAPDILVVTVQIMVEEEEDVDHSSKTVAIVDEVNVHMNITNGFVSNFYF